MTIPAQDPAASTALQRTYGLVGRVALQVDEVIVPVAIVDTLETGRERPAFGLQDQPAVALERSIVQLLNPAGSGVTAHVDRLICSLAAAGFAFVSMFPTLVAGGAPGVGHWQDTRLPGAPNCFPNRASDAAFLGDLGLEINFDVALRSITVGLNVTLLPGSGVMFQANTVNVASSGSWSWTERNLLPGE